MKKRLITGIIVIVLLILGVGFLTALSYDLNMGGEDNSYTLGNYADNSKMQENNQENNQGNSCGDATYPYPCFQYNAVEQEVGPGKSYMPEQTRLEPCPKLPPKCELCFDSLEQSKGEGKSYIPEQTRKNC